MTMPQPHRRPSPQHPSASQSSLPKLVELSEKDLQAIVGAGVRMNHNEMLVNQRETLQANSQDEPAKIFELSKEDLANISGAGIQINHNETLVEFDKDTQPKPLAIVELSEKALEAIYGGSNNDNANISTRGISVNHNETMVNAVKNLQATPSSKPAQIVELSEEDLAAIAGGGERNDGPPPPGIELNHNETMVNAVKNLQADTKPMSVQIVELSGENLAAIASGSGHSTDPALGANHNETIVHTTASTQSKSAQIVELSEEDLAAIAGGGRGDDCTEIDNCGVNHNETMMSRIEQ
ncbi:MAG: hypothetical protein AAF215_19900 [Cyanobacteria bacterium P01_A01_bin.123]